MGKQKKSYPHVAGKEQWRQKMVEMFPGEAAAIDKYLQLLDVSDSDAVLTHAAHHHVQN